MERRPLLRLFASIPLLAAGRVNAAPAKQQYVLAAPGDATVQKLAVINGKVKAGDNLAILTSVQLTRYQSMLDVYEKKLAVEQRPFTDGRTDDLWKLVQAEAAAAQKAFDEAQLLANTLHEQMQEGVSPGTDYLSSAIELEDRTAELATINNEVAQFPKNMQDAQERLALAAQQLAIQAKALAALSALLTITAPADGIFVASVGAGGFVKKGDAVGIFYP